MQIIESPAELQLAALALRSAGETIALVPTMGNLHEGHLSLVRTARTLATRVIVSDFVNPTQFGPNEDYAAYPRTFEADCALLEREGADIVFHPAPEAMYPEGTSVSLIETSLSKYLCGASRPGHFNGVCTVVAKLFLLAQPHCAVFGQKDAQQLRVLRRMVRDLNFPIQVVGAPIVREADGLAMSSRNQYLTPAQRREAPALHHALEACEAAFAAGERSVAALRKRILDVLAAEAPTGVPDYITLADDETLVPLEDASSVVRPVLAALAVRFGTTRLIDNTELRP